MTDTKTKWDATTAPVTEAAINLERLNARIKPYKSNRQLIPAGLAQEKELAEDRYEISLKLAREQLV